MVPRASEHALFVFTLFLFAGARNGCITMRLFDQNQRAVARPVRPSVLHVSPNLRVRFVVVANGAERAERRRRSSESPKLVERALLVPLILSPRSSDSAPLLPLPPSPIPFLPRRLRLRRASPLPSLLSFLGKSPKNGWPYPDLIMSPSAPAHAYLFHTSATPRTKSARATQKNLG